MTYSSTKEVNLLKRKLEQVAQFGCNAFAILFDDIEPELNETDKEVFQSFAHAHVSVTNEVYEALNKPSFLFCPTEYCASRAIPNVRSSEYLNTIGNKLIPDIMVMWTGNKVISKILTVQQLQELGKVLKRQPVIWDNLTANDFDQRRVFLGPYDGRSTDIKEYIRGVLTNPNCEFEANFITLHTISQWAKCENDIKPLAADSLDEEDTDLGTNDFFNLNPNTYHPKRALKKAIEEWLFEFNKIKNIFPKPSDIISKPLITSSTIDNPIIDEELIKERSEKMIEDLNNAIKDNIPITELNADSTFQPITKELTNSLLDPPVILNPSLEPMDCVDIATNNGNNENKASIVVDENMEGSQSDLRSKESAEIEVKEEVESNHNTESNSEEEEMQTEQTINTENEFTYEDVNFLVDLFYLPFEHGSNGLKLLNEFYWLINNAFLIATYRSKKALNPDKSPDVIEWYDRAFKFEKTAMFVSRLLNKLTVCKNRCIFYELYPYLWDINSVISLLNSYIKWLSLGHVPTEPTFLQSSFSFNWFSKGYKEAFGKL